MVMRQRFIPLPGPGRVNLHYILPLIDCGTAGPAERAN
jgi:hypothetical protein